VAQQRPDLLRKLVLAEPGGDLDASLDPALAPAAPSALGARVQVAAKMVRDGDIDGGLQSFTDGVNEEGAWRRLPAAVKQQLRDNALTLIGQVHEDRKPYRKADAQEIRTPTLLIGGGDTTGSLSVMWRVLAENIAGSSTAVIPAAKHWMFEDDPERFCRVVTEFLTA
jgi:esterase